MNNTDLSTSGNSAEDAMRIHAVNHLSRDRYDASLLVEASRRVVFKNCLAACEVDMDRFSKFNKDFYYNMLDEQKCLQTCFNTRMVAHFGEERAMATDGLQIDFASLKRGYHKFEKMHPDNRKIGTFWSGAHEDKIDSILEGLREKSQAANEARDKY